MKKFQGHLSLKRDDDSSDNSSSNSSNNIIYKMMTNWPLLVEIKEPSEVYDSQKMLEVLLLSSGRGGGLKSQVNEGNRIDHRSTSTKNAKFSQRKKMKHQQKKKISKKK